MRRLALLGLVALLGCAHAHSGDRSTWAFGAQAVATIYTCAASEGRETVHENEPVLPDDPGLVSTLATALGGKVPRKLTDTERPAFPCSVAQESHGSAFLEPLAKVIGEVGVAFGTAAGRVVVCVVTLGWRCGP